MIVVDSKKGCKTNRVITGRVKSAKRGLQRSYSAGNSVVIIIFIFGIGYLSSIIGFNKAIAVGLLPFIPSELFKIALALFIIPSIWKYINK